MSVTVHHGDSREVLKTLADASVDACVCDPPYALVSIGKRFGKPGAAPAKSGKSGAYARASAGFMGQKWDTGETAFDPDFWREVWRVLKPGAHVVAFSGTRTYHRLACAVEDAGFEIRDMLAWLYGSGFPKSHDVAKGIDALDAVGPRRERALKFTAWMRATRMTAKRINTLTGSSMGSHYLTDAEQPEVPTRAMFDVLRPHLPQVPAWVEALIDAREVESANLARREVVGQHADAAQAARWRETYEGGEAGEAGAITRAFTPEAQAWEGWGTALKPALEPVVFARKPLAGTVADNVMRFGTGAINVDGCRVAMSDEDRAAIDGATWRNSNSAVYGDFATDGQDKPISAHDGGRWPANVVHDGSGEVEGVFPETGPSSARPRHNGDFSSVAKGADKAHVTLGHEDLGGTASRFFYSAKADAEDRLGSKHPTVKPIDLMRWLCRLVTPPGGLILDPFAGSGTTGIAAQREGFDAVLVEREAEYVADIRLRLEHAAGAAVHSVQLKARNKPQKPLGGLFEDVA